MDSAISQYLEEDHRRIEDALRRASTSPPDLAVYLEFRAALLRHIAMEEKILLPAARTANKGSTIPGTEQLHLDHGALAALLVLTPTGAIISAIQAILSRHNEIEEGPNGVYDQCERLLGPQANAITARLKATPAVAMAPLNDSAIAVESMRAAIRRAGYLLEL